MNHEATLGVAEELALLDARIPQIRDEGGTEHILRPGGQEFIVTHNPLGGPSSVRRVR